MLSNRRPAAAVTDSMEQFVLNVRTLSSQGKHMSILCLIVT
jgi:hypothetical protein